MFRLKSGLGYWLLLANLMSSAFIRESDSSRQESEVIKTDFELKPFKDLEIVTENRDQEALPQDEVLEEKKPEIVIPEAQNIKFLAVLGSDPSKDQKKWGACVGFAVANFLEDMMINAVLFTDGRRFYLKEQGKMPEVLQDFGKRHELTFSFLEGETAEITPDEFATRVSEVSLAMRKIYNVQSLSGVDAALLGHYDMNSALDRLLMTGVRPLHDKEAETQTALAKEAQKKRSFFRKMIEGSESSPERVSERELFQKPVSQSRELFAIQSDPEGFFAAQDKKAREIPALDSYYKIATVNEEAFKTLLLNGIPIFAACSWPESWKYPVYDGEKKMLHLPFPTRKKNGGGHAFDLIGVDTSTHSVLLKNSWGENWGIPGTGQVWVPFEALKDAKMDVEMYVAVPQGGQPFHEDITKFLEKRRILADLIDCYDKNRFNTGKK